ncbi:hypothetical protein NQ315_003238 [Exocentrus adspersus]|uniref:DDE Tnp4 domain-containing protein n=1 Tax=Exocentrus adspersus TaxID=1586481 RepID=A0AAV8VN91_9CUCU|nr:hypothetical protein NQ315_003238 [Exocentrus adspersus]
MNNIDITCAGTSGIKCSVGVQAKPYMRSKYVSCHLVPNVSSIATSPIKLRLPTVSPRNKPCEREPSASEEEKEVSEFLPSSSTSGQLDIQELLIEDKKAEEQSQSLNVVIKIIENNPKRYLGVPKKWYDILLKLLCQHDCLEIEIEKPTDPMKQALTWSEYKKCNTFKYLISCTPDGFINFVSNGFGGRISDVLLLEQCNYINVVPHGCAVMADRGFKHVDNLLKEKNCQLIKPPSVSSSTKPSKAEVIESKRIASLRIHVERLIRRLREFAYLKPHAVLNHQMLAYTDDSPIIQTMRLAPSMVFCTMLFLLEVDDADDADDAETADPDT